MVASNCYGQLSGPSGSGANTRIQQIKGFSKINSTSVGERTVCRACGSYEHRLDKCHRFQLMTRLQRLDLLRRNGLCFNCFEPHHRSTDCTSESRCTRVGCGQCHHTLLHVKDKTATDSSSVNAVRGARSKCFLGYVPVRLVGPNSSLETYAFIDDGSDSTLIT